MVSVEKMPTNILRKLDIPVAPNVVSAHTRAAAPRTAVVGSPMVRATTSATMPNSPTPMLKGFMGDDPGALPPSGDSREGREGRVEEFVRADHRPPPESTGVRSQCNIGGTAHRQHSVSRVRTICRPGAGR